MLIIYCAQLFIPDGRVTKDGMKKLIDETKCTAWIHAEEDNDSVQELGINIRTCALPSVEWCLDSPNHKTYPYTKTFDEAKFDEIIIVHTSGTTGKRIIFSFTIPFSYEY